MTHFSKRRFSIFFISISIIYFSCKKSQNDQTSDLPNADQFITWNINGSKGSITSPNDSLASARYSSDTHLTGSSTTSQNTIYLIFMGNRSAGLYPIGYSDFFINQQTYPAIPNSLNAKVTTYGAIGDYVIGSYSGQLTDPISANVISVSGNFRIKTR